MSQKRSSGQCVEAIARTRFCGLGSDRQGQAQTCTPWRCGLVAMESSMMTSLDAAPSPTCTGTPSGNICPNPAVVASTGIASLAILGFDYRAPWRGCDGPFIHNLRRRIGGVVMMPEASRDPPARTWASGFKLTRYSKSLSPSGRSIRVLHLESVHVLAHQDSLVRGT